VLIVDDEAPARGELAYLLREDERVGEVRTAAGGPEALRMLAEEPADVVFCDIRMPGLGGLDLARETAHFAQRPKIIFVTAYEEHAVDAFELAATDYVLKPVQAERLAEAVRRVVAGGEPAAPDSEETVAVELAGVTRFVRRSQVRYIEAQGDYVRLHTAEGSHLVRTPLSALEQRWAGAGFVRIHRSTLVSVKHIDEVRVVDGRCSVRLGAAELPVSRRHSRALRDRLLSR
jgi:DNA-binding LytR/AlgR family response regulator